MLTNHKRRRSGEFLGLPLGSTPMMSVQDGKNTPAIFSPPELSRPASRVDAASTSQCSVNPVQLTLVSFGDPVVPPTPSVTKGCGGIESQRWDPFFRCQGFSYRMYVPQRVAMGSEERALSFSYRRARPGKECFWFGQTDRQTDRKMDRQTDINRQADILIDRQAGRQMDRQTGRHK